MTAARRIVLIDDDTELASVLGSSFSSPEFVIDVFCDPREALLKLHDLAPALILCSLDTPNLPGRSVLRVVKRSERLGAVPFVFLCAEPTQDDLVDSLEDGADDLIAKPVDVPVLIARLRALLRLVGGVNPPVERADAVTGSVGSAGAVRLLRFCEDFRLTGRLTIDGPGARYWAEFAGGELVRAGRDPADPDVDPLDALLAAREGTYRIEQTPIDAGALRDPEAAAEEERAPAAEAVVEAVPPDAAAILPGGRLSMIESRSGNLQIQTEGENRPEFTITTVVVRNGRVLRRFENAWTRPLERGADAESARRQVDEQHDRIVASIRELAQEGTARAASGNIPGADGRLLAWSLEQFSEAASALLGAAATAALLRRSRKRVLALYPGLASFEVTEQARVRFDPARGRKVMATTVAGIATWIADFTAESSTMRPEVGRIDLREVTRGAGDDLDRAGLYSALQSARPLQNRY